MRRSNGWRALAQAIRADAARRYDTLTQLAHAAQLSVRTVEDLTAGRRTSYREATLRSVEVALGWEHGDVERVVAGGKPRRLPDPDLAKLIDAWPRLSDKDKAIILAVLDALRS